MNLVDNLSSLLEWTKYSNKEEDRLLSHFVLLQLSTTGTLLHNFKFVKPPRTSLSARCRTHCLRLVWGGQLTLLICAYPLVTERSRYFMTKLSMTFASPPTTTLFSLTKPSQFAQHSTFRRARLTRLT
jgi:hypothetical protein